MIINFTITSYLRHTMWLFMAMLLTNALAQDEKIEPRVDVSYFKKGDDVPYLKILVRKRIERRYYTMPGQVVTAFFQEETDKNKMGQMTTNDRGECIIEMPVELMEGWHNEDSFDFIASVAESDSTDEVTETLTITKARLMIAGDDDRNITVRLESRADSGWVAVPEVETKVFVVRSFGRLIVTEDYLETDEDGQSEVAFELDVPGDKDGVISIGAMVEDHDEFGNIFAYTSKKWGRPVVDDNSAFESRTLWATRDKTPYWLLVFPNLIIAGVWGVIIYLVILIFRIRKLSKEH